MIFTLKAESPPLREVESGALRVGETRVLFELVVQAFQDGRTPESIVQMYATLALGDVYSVISYYLRHRDEVQLYLDKRECDAENARLRISTQQRDLSSIRERLAARRPA